ERDPLRPEGRFCTRVRCLRFFRGTNLSAFFRRGASMNCTKRCLRWAQFLTALALASEADANVIVVGGLAEVGANFGSSPSLSQPPASIPPGKAQYDFRDLATSPGGSIDKGWASMKFSVSGGSNAGISVSGGTNEGFNGFFNPASGWLYGQG